MAAWDRQPNEPPKAYSHFCIYRDTGPDRTLPKVAELCAVSLSRVKQLAERYCWTDRADKWDAHVRALHDRAYLAEVAKRGRQRAQAFLKLLAVSLRALDQVKLESATLAQVAAALKVAAEGMRLEEGLETSRVVMEVTDVRTVLAQLPPNIRSGVCKLLAADIDAGADTGSDRAIPLGLGTGE